MSGRQWRLLVRSGNQAQASEVERALRNHGHPVRVGWVPDGEALTDVLQRAAPDLLLLADDGGLEPGALRPIESAAPDTPVLLLVEQPGLEATLRALRLGAEDAVALGGDRHLAHLEGVCLRALMLGHHLRELRRLRERTERLKRLHGQLLSETQDAVARLQEGILVHANRAFAQRLGFETEEAVLGTPLLDWVQPEAREALKAQLKRLLKPAGRQQPEVGRFQAPFRHQEAGVVTLELELGASESDQGPVIDLLIRAAPTSVRSRTLPSEMGREALAERLRQPLRAGERLTLVALLLDGFRNLESRIGYLAVAPLLAEVERWLDDALGGDATLYRTQAGEWVALIAGPDPAAVEARITALSTAVQRQLFVTEGFETHLSFTITAYPLAADEDAGQALGRAIEAARQLADKGGRTAQLLGALAQASAQSRALEQQAQAVRAALKEGRLRLAFQAILSLEGDTTPRHDVLLRLRDERGQEIHAGAFITAAAQFGLMSAIDPWVLGEALSTLQRRRSGQGKDSQLFVKLAESSLRDLPRVLPALTAVLDRDPETSQSLVLQLPESAVQLHIGKARQLFDALKARGVGLALEHFGLHSQSAQLLTALPWAYVKFDPRLTSDLAKERRARFTELIELARQRDIKTIVSHVENAQAMAQLWQLGINFVMGYSVQEPEVVMLAAEDPGSRLAPAP